MHKRLGNYTITRLDYQALGLLGARGEIFFPKFFSNKQFFLQLFCKNFYTSAII